MKKKKNSDGTSMNISVVRIKSPELVKDTTGMDDILGVTIDGQSYIVKSDGVIAQTDNDILIDDILQDWNEFIKEEYPGRYPEITSDDLEVIEKFNPGDYPDLWQSFDEMLCDL